MDIVTGIIVYIMLWWWILFMVLPWGVQAAEKPEIGMAASAPVKPRLKIKLVITTFLSAFCWFGFYFLQAHFSWDDLETILGLDRLLTLRG